MMFIDSVGGVQRSWWRCDDMKWRWRTASVDRTLLYLWINFGCVYIKSWMNDKNSPDEERSWKLNACYCFVFTPGYLKYRTRAATPLAGEREFHFPFSIQRAHYSHELSTVTLFAPPPSHPIPAPYTRVKLMRGRLSCSDFEERLIIEFISGYRLNYWFTWSGREWMKLCRSIDTKTPWIRY